jgi:hypothetical protein
MRRAAEPPAARPAPVTPPARTPEQRRQADDVYSFLSSFTAGVRRGLDETTRDQPTGPAHPSAPAPPEDPRWR